MPPQWFESYASPYRYAGIPLVDFAEAARGEERPAPVRLLVCRDGRRGQPQFERPSAPRWTTFRTPAARFPRGFSAGSIKNFPGQPDGAVFDALAVERCVVAGRTCLNQ